MPAIERVINLSIISEEKHGEGLHRSPRDLGKAISHGEQAREGLSNPDGESHKVAMAQRALKAVLAEVEDGL